MQKITPFLWFDTDAEEAINFYVSTFKDNPAGSAQGESKIVSITRYPEGPLEAPMKGMEGKVLTGVFELAGQRFMALDGGPVFDFKQSVSFYVECETQEEIDYFWDKLKEGGKEVQCGWVTDKYGLPWQIIPPILGQLLQDKDKVKAGRVMQAMLKMVKIDIAELKRAAEDQ